jgi:hypothetical protein
VAEAISTGLRRGAPGARVQCLHVGRLPSELTDVDLLVLGGPTHLLGLPGARTRRMWVDGIVEASRRGEPHGHHPLEPGAVGPGLREWLADLPDAAPPGVLRPGGHDLLDGVPDDGFGGGLLGGLSVRHPIAAAFDTRPHRPLLGSAARSIARALRQHGYALVAEPEGFEVERPGGALRRGEVERATAWGSRLARLVVPSAPAA